MVNIIKTTKFALVRYCLAWLLLLPGLAYSQSPAVEIGLAGGANADVAPRTVTTAALRITNHSGTTGEFEAMLALPQGWRLITPEQPFTLERGASVVRMVSLFVPESATAGQHALTYTVTNRKQPAIQGKYAMAMRVASSVKLQVTLLDIPEIVIAGEAYTGTFVLHNRGNAAVAVTYKAHSSRGYALDLATGTLNLPPGASSVLKIRVTTGPIQNLEQDWLVLVAQVRGADTSERATGVIKMAPRITGAEQRYNTIPATVGLRVVAQDKGGKRTNGTQAEITGGGKLGDSVERSLHFLLRGPGTGGESVFGRLDEYRIDYTDAQLAVSLGDLSYGLSPLTEFGRYGRGLAATYQADKVNFRGYAMKDRFSRTALIAQPLNAQPLNPGQSPEEVARLAALKLRLPGSTVSEQGLSMGYAYSDNARFDLNYLRKQDASCRSGSTIYSLRNQSRWEAGLTSEVELGQSTCAGVRGEAFRAHMSDSRYRLKYNISVLRADSDYQGYNPDQQLTVFNAEYPLTAALLVHANHRTQQSNLERAVTRAALNETQSGVGVGYRFDGGSRADLEFTGRRTTDRRMLPDFAANHHAARLSLQKQYRGISVYGSVALGATADLLRQNSFPTRQLLTSAYWAASDRLSYGTYLFYVDNAYSTKKELPHTSAGVTGRYHVSDRTVLDANLQASHARTGSVSVDVRVAHQRDNGHVVALALRHGTGGITQSDMMLTYTVPLAIPISKRNNVATVTGRVFDQETGQGVSDLVLRLGGIIAVSGKNGEFTFPSVLVGTYYLSIDHITGISGKIPAYAMPMAVEVHQSAGPNIDIPLVQSAILAGEITVHEAEPTPDMPVAVGAGPGQDALVIPRGLLVVLRKGELVYKRLTDENGKFRLGGIAPGQWTVSVEEGIPAGYALEKQQFLVNLAPATELSVTFKLRQKIRAIKMLQQMKPVGS